MLDELLLLCLWLKSCLHERMLDTCQTVSTMQMGMGGIISCVYSIFSISDFLCVAMFQA